MRLCPLKQRTECFHICSTLKGTQYHSDICLSWANMYMLHFQSALFSFSLNHWIFTHPPERGDLNVASVAVPKASYQKEASFFLIVSHVVLFSAPFLSDSSLTSPSERLWWVGIIFDFAKFKELWASLLLGGNTSHFPVNRQVQTAHSVSGKTLTNFLCSY